MIDLVSSGGCCHLSSPWLNSGPSLPHPQLVGDDTKTGIITEPLMIDTVD
eukprot:SAG11_NODE_38323_length_252_cov_11.124183_1_plen_49_part_01